MQNPANLLPDSMKGIQSIIKAAYDAGVPRSTMDLAHLRASQINGCSPCVYSGAVSAKKAGESDERLFAVAAWRETDLFTDSERAALALAESMTRMADRADPSPTKCGSKQPSTSTRSNWPGWSSGSLLPICSTG